MITKTKTTPTSTNYSDGTKEYFAGSRLESTRRVSTLSITSYKEIDPCGDACSIKVPVTISIKLIGDKRLTPNDLASLGTVLAGDICAQLGKPTTIANMSMGAIEHDFSAVAEEEEQQI